MAPRYVSSRKCVECIRAKNEAWQKANPEKNRARGAAYRSARKDEIKAAKYEWRRANLDRYRAYVAAYKKMNGEKVRRRDASRRQANLERELARASAWRKANPDKCWESSSRYRALKVAAPGRGVSSTERRLLLESAGGLCTYCLLPRKLTIDHVVPLIQGGAHDPDNCVAACRRCNASKGDTPLLIWLARRRT